MTGLSWKAETGGRLIKQRAQRTADAHQSDTTLGRVSQMGSVMAVVTLGIVALIGLLIFDEINEALPDMSTNSSHANYSELADSRNQLVSGFADSMDLIPVVLIVIIAGVVLGVVQRMR